MEVYIFGDFNINSLKKDRETSIKNYFIIIISFGLKNFINVPIRVTHQEGALINLFYYTYPQRVQNTQAL